MTGRNDWNTALPPLDEIQIEAEDLAEKGVDVHTVHIVLNGHHGGFDVTLEATTADMEDVKRVGVLSRYGAVDWQPILI